nr:MAG: major capsid protein [Microvirus Sku122]
MKAAGLLAANEHFTSTKLKAGPRTKFDLTHTHKTTFNAGKLVPIECTEVLPGDTFDTKTNFIVRMSTPIVPVMDNAILYIYHFFVPKRIIWNNWKKYLGANEDAWENNRKEILIPTIKSTDITKMGYAENTLAAYMGVPINKKVFINQGEISSLQFRAYAQIWNDWFRNEDIQQEIYFDRGDTVLDYKNIQPITTTSFVNNVQYGFELAPVSKNPDYFTTCLPAPQRGPSVQLPLGATAPIRNIENPNPTELFQPQYYNIDGSKPKGTSHVSITEGKTQAYTTTGGGTYAGDIGLALEADLSQATAASINKLRQAVAIQELFESFARGGTRYKEILWSQFGVNLPDATLQRAEYLGSDRFFINMDQVVQTTQGGTSPAGDATLGTTGAYSLTGGQTTRIIKSFGEHGYLIKLMTVRVIHTYSQGLAKQWSRKRRLEEFWPELENIGEAAVYKKEIFFDETEGNTNTNEQVFGYQEMYAEYKYKPSTVSGNFAPNAKTPLTAWTYTDNYANAPTLNSQFNNESKDNIGQTLAFLNEDQFLIDFYIEEKATRPLRAYAIPGGFTRG